jgi:hypothetical protein
VAQQSNWSSGWTRIKKLNFKQPCRQLSAGSTILKYKILICVGARLSSSATKALLSVNLLCLAGRKSKCQAKSIKFTDTVCRLWWEYNVAGKFGVLFVWIIYGTKRMYGLHKGYIILSVSCKWSWVVQIHTGMISLSPWHVVHDRCLPHQFQFIIQLSSHRWETRNFINWETRYVNQKLIEVSMKYAELV